MEQNFIKPRECVKAKKSLKKRIPLVLLLIKIPIVIQILFLLFTVPAIDAVKYDYIYGAHRGDSLQYTENTLEALKSASESNEYEFVEFDIQYTKDNKIVVFHDHSLIRMNGTSDKIQDLTYEELQNITEFNIPTYQETIEVIGNDKKMDIEIKTSGDLEKDYELVDFVVKDVTEKGIRQNILISSPTKEIIQYSKTNYPDIKTGKVLWVTHKTLLPFDFLTEDLYEDIQETQADYIMLHGQNIHNIDKLVENKPQDKTLVFWYFTNEIYLIQADENDEMW